MKQSISNITLTIKRQKAGKQELTLIGKTKGTGRQEYSFGNEKAQAVLIIEERESLLKGSIQLELKNEAFRENDNLAPAEPVVIGLKLDKQPVRMTAMHLHRDWWTRPEFLSGFEQMPDRTQSLYMEYDGGCSYLLPMAGKACKTMLKAGEADLLTMEMTSYTGGMHRIEEPVFYLSEGADIYEAVHKAFEAVTGECGVPEKRRKEYPDMFEYLGWCSWDAFYTDISEEKVRAKAKELTEKQVPVRWFLLDDGWLSVHGQRLYDLMPEKEKFPRGFRRMIQDIKETSGIDRFGVWHALGGYWGGIEPDSPAAIQEREHLYLTVNGKYLPHPSAEKGYGFYRGWYEQLRAEGIDFVKVDGQSAVKNYYENELPVCLAARDTHRALEGAAAAYMGGRLINCMGMGMENILGRQGSAISRNSDDFVPESENGFTEHLLQNAYNAIYHDELYYCDWDMFWTFHPDAAKHAILRAVSGGPVYISDRIGDTEGKAVAPLTYADGRILRMERAAKPSPACIFRNPLKEGLMKLTNVADCGAGVKGGAAAVYNLCGREETDTLGAADIHDLEGGSFYLYDCMKKCGRVIEREEHVTVTLPAEGFALYLLVPLIQDKAYLGLTEKYISFHGIEEIKENEAGVHIVVKEAGAFTFYQKQPVVEVLVNGVDRTKDVEEKDGLYTVRGTGMGRMLVTIR